MGQMKSQPSNNFEVTTCVTDDVEHFDHPRVDCPYTTRPQRIPTFIQLLREKRGQFGAH
jgi:hypothetical protein